MIASRFELWGLKDGFSDSHEVVLPEIVLHSSGGGGQAIADTGNVSGKGSLKKS